ncbi:GTP-binding protein [Psychromonas hadalis]|uniref:GTP-binding protein n=1 Tax=Psychromonas hadalis TaxID=211669 RepID=UPI0003B568C4|nr:GTP-binding protein [Psychromonas hadalis]
MKQKIACHIISGFLGAGKTTFINKLLSVKPDNEKWVILVNESGHSHYAKQQLTSQQIIVKEVYGGCLCCSAGMPFRVALNTLIKAHQPQRIFIEPAGAGHLANIQKLLQGEFYQAILSLQSTLCLVAHWQLTDPKYSENSAYLALIAQADKLCFYEDDAENLAKKMAIEYSKPLYRVQHNIDDLQLLNPPLKLEVFL